MRNQTKKHLLNPYLSRRDFLKLAQLIPLGLLSQSLAIRQHLDSDHRDLPNILIIVFDALTARNMSLYGYPRHTTPNIEQAANEGAAVFHRHYAGGSWTPPGTASLLTGVYPWSHRALHPFGTMREQFKQDNIFSLLGKRYNVFTYSHNLFANILLDQCQQHINTFLDQEELCLHSGHYAGKIFKKELKTLAQAEEVLFWNPNGSSASFLLSRFRRSNQLRNDTLINQNHIERFPRGVPNTFLAYFTLEDAIEWVKRQTSVQRRPYLGYVHLMPPHSPYTTRHDFIDRFRDTWEPACKPEGVFSQMHTQAFLNEQRRYYDEYIGYVDAEFGRLFDSMKENGSLDETMLILTSDHGEMFERGIWEHETPTLYEPILHIPLLIWKPGENQRVDFHKPTSCVDVPPTLLQAIGQPIHHWCEGQTLPTLDDTTNNKHSMFAIDSKENSKFAPLTKGSIAHYKGPYKLTYYFGYKQAKDFFEFYNIENDPEELTNLYPKQPSIAKKMKEELLEKLSGKNQQFQRKRQVDDQP